MPFSYTSPLKLKHPPLVKFVPQPVSLVTAAWQVVRPCTRLTHSTRRPTTLPSVYGVAPTQLPPPAGVPPATMHHWFCRKIFVNETSSHTLLMAQGVSLGEPQNAMPPDWMQVCAAVPPLAAARIRKNTDAAIVRGNAWILIITPSELPLAAEDIPRTM